MPILKTARVVAFVAAVVVAVWAIFGAVNYLLRLNWRVSYENTYYEPLFEKVNSKQLARYLYKKTGAKIPGAIFRDYSEVVVSGLPVSFVRPPIGVTEQESYLASGWYYEPAFGVKNQGAYILHIFYRSRYDPPASVELGNNNSVRLNYIADGLCGNDYGSSNPFASYSGSEADWETLVTPNDRPYTGPQLILLKFSFYSGPQSGKSFYVLSKSARQ